MGRRGHTRLLVDLGAWERRGRAWECVDRAGGGDGEVTGLGKDCKRCIADGQCDSENWKIERLLDPGFNPIWLFFPIQLLFTEVGDA